MVLEVGTVHPASGPAFANGVLVIRNGRLAAVGSKDTVEVPANAQVHSYPDGHAYPGLIDAQTDAYTDDSLRGEGNLDGGLSLDLDLRPRNPRDDALVSHGITTAYVAVRSPGQFRGQGAIVRPQAEGFGRWQGRASTGVQARATQGPTPSHQLQRLEQANGLSQLFASLEDYRKAKKDYTTALLKYEKDFQGYLEASGKPGEKKESAPSTGNAPNAPAGTAMQDPQPQKPAPAPAEGQAAPAKPEGPKKPSYPKKPTEDPTKEALLKVLDGELALRVEVHRADEIRAVLALKQKYGIPLLILEQAYGAGSEGKAIAEQGAMVVLSEILPGRQPKVYEAFDLTALPSQLQASGVPFAIATGSARRAELLPLMAANAIAGGLNEEAALRAITLTPAEILGIAPDTGSLSEGKLADVLITDGPLFASDSRVLLVLAQGRTEYEAK